MKLVWSVFALADRDGIFTHIEADNPGAAIAVDERIAAAARRLVDFPESGRPGRVAGTRELVITGTPYIQPSSVATSGAMPGLSGKAVGLSGGCRSITVSRVSIVVPCLA